MRVPLLSNALVYQIIGEFLEELMHPDPNIKVIISFFHALLVVSKNFTNPAFIFEGDGIHENAVTVYIEFYYLRILV